MAGVGPRLLVALRPADDTAATIERTLPGIAWSYLASGASAEWGDVDALLLGSFARDAKGLEPAAHLPRLRFVQTLYTGLDGVPMGRFAPSVEIAGNVGAFAPFVAEHGIALALAAARLVPTAQAQVVSSRLRPAPVNRLLLGRTALILGYGAIGHAIAERLAGFGMHLTALSRAGRPEPGLERVYAAADLREALRQADVVFEVRPLTISTRGSIGTRELSGMREDAIFVNVGRAGTVQEEPLYQHLLGHPGFRAGLDVWWHEDYKLGRLESAFPFATLPNVVATPHSAAFAPGSSPRALDYALQNLARYFRGERPAHIADRSEYDP